VPCSVFVGKFLTLKIELGAVVVNVEKIPGHDRKPAMPEWVPTEEKPDLPVRVLVSHPPSPALTALVLS
jgi:hypothetical protein